VRPALAECELGFREAEPLMFAPLEESAALWNLPVPGWLELRYEGGTMTLHHRAPELGSPLSFRDLHWEILNANNEVTLQGAYVEADCRYLTLFPGQSSSPFKLPRHLEADERLRVSLSIGTHSAEGERTTSTLIP
jgi:hypothetical protein